MNYHRLNNNGRANMSMSFIGAIQLFKGSIRQIQKEIKKSNSIKINNTCQYTLFGIQHFFSKIDQLKIETLQIHNSPQFKIEHMNNVKFNHLKVLDISNNNLVSIENLQLVDFGRLKQINISKNKLVEIKSLRKITNYNNLMLDYIRCDINAILLEPQFSRQIDSCLLKINFGYPSDSYPKKVPMRNNEIKVALQTHYLDIKQNELLKKLMRPRGK